MSQDREDAPASDLPAAARRLAAEVFAARAPVWDRERRYCHDNIPDLRAAGLMGMTLPPELGGRGASWETAVAAIEAVAAACTLTARVVVEANMGAVSAVMAYGTEAQRRLAAARVLAGDKPAICITEPEAGSAASEMRTTARRVPGGYLLDGVKHWITGGGVSRLHLVFAQVAGRAGAEGIGGVLLDIDPAAPPRGYRVARHERTMGLCGMPEAELRFEGLFVPSEMALLPPGSPAEGFKHLMNAYNSQRLGAAAVALGVAQGAFDRARAYMREREQFGRPIAEFQGLQWMLADMDVKLHTARLLIREAARSRGPGGSPFPCPAMAARAKLHASESAIAVVSDALQILGARGYGSEEPVERMYRDVRMFTIGGGTAQILRTQIAGHVLGIKTPQRREADRPLAAE